MSVRVQPGRPCHILRSTPPRARVRRNVPRPISWAPCRSRASLAGSRRHKGRPTFPAGSEPHKERDRGCRRRRRAAGSGSGKSRSRAVGAASRARSRSLFSDRRGGPHHDCRVAGLRGPVRSRSAPVARSSLVPGARALALTPRPRTSTMALRTGSPSEGCAGSPSFPPASCSGPADGSSKSARKPPRRPVARRPPTSFLRFQPFSRSSDVAFRSGWPRWAPNLRPHLERLVDLALESVSAAQVARIGQDLARCSTKRSRRGSPS